MSYVTALSVLGPSLRLGGICTTVSSGMIRCSTTLGSTTSVTARSRIPETIVKAMASLFPRSVRTTH